MNKKLIFLFLFFWILFPKGIYIPAQGTQSLEEAACIQINRGEVDRAVEILEKLIKALPKNLDAKLYLGISFYLKNETEDAFQIFNEIEKELNRMMGASRSFGDQAFFANMGMDRRAGVIFSEERKGLLYFFLGLTLKEKKEFKNAEKKFNKSLKLEYDEMAVHVHLFDLYVKMRDLKSAAKQWDELEKISDKNDLLIFLKGYLKYRNDKIEEALEAFEKVAPTDMEAKKNMARIYYNKGDYQKSLQIWQEILSENREDKEALIDMGRIFFHTGDSEKALEYFSKAGIEISPERYSPKEVLLAYENQLKKIELDLKCKLSS